MGSSFFNGGHSENEITITSTTRQKSTSMLVFNTSMGVDFYIQLPHGDGDKSLEMSYVTGFFYS